LVKRLCPIAIDALAFVLFEVNRHLFFSGVHAMRVSFFMQHEDIVGDVYCTACEFGLRPSMPGSMSAITHFKLPIVIRPQVQHHDERNDRCGDDPNAQPDDPRQVEQQPVDADRHARQRSESCKRC